MSDVSATCPDVRIASNSVLICDDWYDPQREQVCVESYDLDAFIELVIAARNKLRQTGCLTSWSRDADGMGNCGPVPPTAMPT